MSVVIPHYNHAHLVSEALTAIAQQTMFAFEVVVVDDGSTDDNAACAFSRWRRAFPIFAFIVILKPAGSTPHAIPASTS